MINIFQNYDILCFTETWLSDLYNPEVKGFFNFILNRTCKHKGAKRSSGGIMVYVRDSLKNYVEFMKNVEDCIIWLKIKGERVECGKDVLVCLCYNIPTGSSREQFVNRNVFDLISDDLYFYQNQYNDDACVSSFFLEILMRG